MKEFKEDIEFFVKKIEYIIPLIITAILSFGFVITHYSVNIDTLSAERYYREGELLAQSRYGGVLLDKIFKVMEFNPFFVDCLAVIFLIAASVVFCILFKRISNSKINIVSYIIFSCLFVSYPLINEIFVYTPMSLGVCFSFFMVAVALNLLYLYKKNNNKKYLLYVILILCLVNSIYESSATVYLCGIFIMEIIDYIYSQNKKTLFTTIKQILRMIVPLLIALILNLIISKLIFILFNILPSNNAAKKIMYQELGLIEGSKNLLKTMFYSYFVNGFFYLPITIMQIACLVMLILAIVYGIKEKNITIFLLFVGSIFTIFALSILQGNAAAYRTCQVFQIFSAFAFMILIQTLIDSNKNRIINNIFVILCFIIIFYQAKDLNKYFYVNYVRYEQEENYLISVAERLEHGNYDIENKPVVFIVNEYKPSNYILNEINPKTSSIGVKIANKIVNIFDPDNNLYNEKDKYIAKPMETNIQSYLSWGTYAFKELNTEIFKWLSMLGYDDFKQGTVDSLNLLDETLKQAQENNEESDIIEGKEIIVVLIDRRV